MKQVSEIHFTSKLNKTATLDDLNYEYMKEYLVRSHAAPEIRALSKPEMAKAMNLIGETECGDLRAKNFAVLMFADRPADFIPYACVEVIREAVRTGKVELKRFDGPVWIQAKQVIRDFEDVVHATDTIRDPFTNAAHKVSNWPPRMFAELSTNCVLHKDYSKQDYVRIHISADRISFRNPNRPLPPVTIAGMNTDTEFPDRNYRNTELMEMFYSLGLSHSNGSGIGRAKEAMEYNASPRLVFGPDQDKDETTMVTAYMNEEFAAIQKEETNRWKLPARLTA